MDYDGRETEELTVAEVDTDTTEVAALSLNSMGGFVSKKTLKILGEVGGISVVVLVDSGATHNFISKEIVEKAKLSLTSSTNYGVILGTDEAICAAGVCKGVILTISDITIVHDFLPLPLGSADVILGVAWLETLGKIQFDYRLSTMEFQIGEWEIQLQGDRSLVKSHVSLKSMIKSFSADDQWMLIELSTLSIKEEKSTPDTSETADCPSVL